MMLHLDRTYSDWLFDHTGTEVSESRGVLPLLSPQCFRQPAITIERKLMRTPSVQTKSRWPD
jgi:hypothetical protein